MEAHFFGVQLARDHRKRAYKRIESRLEVGHAKVRTYFKRKHKSDKNDEKNGQKFGRIGQCPYERHHVHTKHLQLLYIERKDQKRKQYRQRPIGRLQAVIVRKQRTYGQTVREQFGNVLQRRKVGEAFEDQQLKCLLDKTEYNHEHEGAEQKRIVRIVGQIVGVVVQIERRIGRKILRIVLAIDDFVRKLDANVGQLDRVDRQQHKE